MNEKQMRRLKNLNTVPIAVKDLVRRANDSVTNTLH